MSTNIYVLKLKGGYYYVGKSDNIAQRIQQHLDGNGSAWTRKHKLISVEKVIEHASPFEEDKITKEYMAKYGIEKVRGGSYVESDLDDFQMEALQRELWAAKDLCTQCGRSNHFAKNCFAKTDVYGNMIEYDDSDSEFIWTCEHCNKEFESEKACVSHERSCKPYKQSYLSTNCYRCGREGHYASECFASKHIHGHFI